MSSQTMVKAKCPICSKKYTVPASACGHRVRCSECHTVFRVPKQTSPHPTEDDIMRWLSEAHEETEIHSESHEADLDHEPDHDHEHEHTREHEVAPSSLPRTPVKVGLSDTHIRWRRTG